MNGKILTTDKISSNYVHLLSELKERIRQSRLRASLSVNKEFVLLYWSIGKRILGAQKREGWGTKVIDRLACDLQNEFSNMKGFSSGNLKYMRKLAEVYTNEPIVQQAVAQIE